MADMDDVGFIFSQEFLERFIDFRIEVLVSQDIVRRSVVDPFDEDSFFNGIIRSIARDERIFHSCEKSDGYSAGSQFIGQLVGVYFGSCHIVRRVAMDYLQDAYGLV